MTDAALSVTTLGAALLVSAAASAACIPLGWRLGRVSRTDAARAGPGGIPVTGGLAVLAGFAAGLAARALAGAHAAVGLAAREGAWAAAQAAPSTWPAWSGTQTAALVLLVCGFWAIGWIDDRRPLAPGLRLVLEAVCASLSAVLFLAGGAVSGPAGAGTLAAAAPLACGAVVGANALNMIDNSDGLAAGMGALTCAALALAGRGGPLFAAAAGGLAGFWLFNLPPARLYLGDHGALPLGALTGAGLAWLAVPSLSGLRASLGVPAALLAAGYLIADPFHTLAFRVIEGRRPWIGGIDHLSHDLARAAGAWAPALSAALLVQLGSTALAALLVRGRIGGQAAWAALGAWLVLLAGCACLRRPHPRV